MKKMIYALWFIMAISVYANEPNNVIDVKPINTSELDDVQAVKNKWTDRDVWRLKLKKDMPSATVKKYLGEPRLEIESSSEVVWYYQNIPTVTFKDRKYKTICPKDGCVFFYRKPKMVKHPSQTRSVLTGKYETVTATFTGREAIYVGEWNEPDWNNITLSDPNNMHKKQIRRPQRWEDIKSWNKLVIGISDNSVDKILGSPLRVETNTDQEEWYYQDIPGCGSIDIFGVVYFQDKKVSRWTFPFWPEINKTLYEQ